MRIQETRINEPTRQEVHTKRHRRLPVGAEVLPAGGVHFRVWASRRLRVEVLLEGGPHGCIAQAWSVVEILRCWVKTAVQGMDQAVVPWGLIGTL